MKIVINHYTKDETNRPKVLTWAAVQFEGDTEIVSHTANGRTSVPDDVVVEDNYTTEFLSGLVLELEGEEKILNRMSPTP
jgi:hypothetical protein